MFYTYEKLNELLCKLLFRKLLFQLFDATLSPSLSPTRKHYYRIVILFRRGTRHRTRIILREFVGPYIRVNADLKLIRGRRRLFISSDNAYLISSQSEFQIKYIIFFIMYLIIAPKRSVADFIKCCFMGAVFWYLNKSNIRLALSPNKIWRETLWSELNPSKVVNFKGGLKRNLIKKKFDLLFRRRDLLILRSKRHIYRAPLLLLYSPRCLLASILKFHF